MSLVKRVLCLRQNIFTKRWSVFSQKNLIFYKTASLLLGIKVSLSFKFNYAGICLFGHLANLISTRFRYLDFSEIEYSVSFDRFFLRRFEINSLLFLNAEIEKILFIKYQEVFYIVPPPKFFLSNSFRKENVNRKNLPKKTQWGERIASSDKKDAINKALFINAFRELFFLFFPQYKIILWKIFSSPLSDLKGIIETSLFSWRA